MPDGTFQADHLCAMVRALVLPHLLLCTIAWAQPVINGPMPGHSDLLEATIWMQCKEPCNALIEYWAIDRPDSILRTPEQRSDPAKAHAMDFVMAPVVPGTTYGYRPVVNGKAVEPKKA